MNKQRALELLRENLEKYLDEGFRFHPRFVQELGELIKGAQGSEAKLFELLVKQLVHVKEQKRNVDKVGSNEILRHLDRDYYSLHLKSNSFNIRLLMTFDQEERPVFLAAFFERAGKKKTGYDEYKPVLAPRFKDLGEQYGKRKSSRVG